MAVRPVYSATIKFDFDTKGLTASLENIESTVRQSVENIGEIAGNITLPKISSRQGPLGGLSETTVAEARDIRARVTREFLALGEDPAIGQINVALRLAADSMRTTTDSIIARLGRLSDESGNQFRELRESGVSEMEALYRSLVGGSIIPDLARDILAELSTMSAKAQGIFDNLVKDIIKLSYGLEDLKTDLPEKSARLASDVILAEKARDTITDLVMAEGLRQSISDTMFSLGDLSEVARKTADSTTLSYIKLQNSVGRGMTEAADVAATSVDALNSKWSLAQEGIDALGESSIKTSYRLQPTIDSIGKMNTAIKGGIIDGLKVATEQVNKFGRGFKDAFSSAPVKSPAETLQFPEFRQTIAQLEQDLTRLPNKSAASFLELKRRFAETRTAAISFQKALEQGVDVDQQGLAKTKERLADISEEIQNMKLDQLARLRDQLARNAASVDASARTFKGRLQNIRDGITLTSETGGNKLLGLRLAISGVGEATGPVTRLLDRFTSRLDDVGKAEDRLSQLTARTTKSLASQNNAIKSAVDSIRDVAKIEGLHAAALNDVDAQVNRVEKAYKDMTTTIEATGRATPQQVARVREEYRLLEESIKLVKIENRDAIGPDTLRALGQLETQISRNVPATRVLAATLDTAAGKVDKLKAAANESNDTVSKSTSIFSRLKAALFGSSDATDEQANSISALRGEMSTLSTVASGLGGIITGAFGGALVIGAIGRIRGSLTGLTESVSSQVQESTARITNAFNLLPGEAEAVSGTISDVYENNFGGSIDEIGDATQRTIARMRDLGVTSQDAIAGAVQDAFALQTSYGFDVPESIDAAAVLMRQFNLDINQSTDFLAKLGQEGVIGSDAIDSILEYSTQVKSAGGDAEDLFNILRTGFAGGGSLGTDKALDLIKEYRLRISEGADATRQALNEIGINSTQLLAQLSSGTVSVLDSFEFVREQLRGVESDTDRARLGALIMGTQFEDLGTQMALSISTAGVSLDDMVGSTDNLSTKYTNLGTGMEAINRRIQITLDPLKTTFITFAGSIVPSVLSAIDSLAPIVQNVASKVGFLLNALRSGDWDTAKGIVVDAFAGIVDYVSETLDWLIASGFDWGANFVVEIANGLIETASQVIVDAMNYIGDLIGSYLAPGSPPEKGVLSDIDKWGKGLVEVFGSSFSSADFGFVEDATRPIEEHFKKTFGKDGFEAFEGIRNKFTEIVGELNTTGLVNADKFKEIADTIGGANTELTKMLKVQLQFKKAQKDLADIQQEVTDAEAAGFVSEGLKKKLKSAEEQVNQAKENVEWQKEFLKFQGLSEDSFGGIAKAASKVGSAAAGGAARATKAIKDAAARQLEFISEGYEKEKALLKEKFDKGVIAEDEFLKELIKLEEKYVDISLERGLGSNEYLQAHIDDLASMKEALEEVQTAAKNAKKGVVPLGEALIGGFDGADFGDPLSGFSAQIEGSKNNLLTGAKSLGEGIATNISDGLLESARVRLAETFAKIGDSVTKLFREKILARITPEQKQAGGLIGSALIGGGVLKLVSSIGLITSNVGALAAVATRFTLVGTAVYLVWQNWDTITLGIGKAIEYVSGVWTNFTEKLGGSGATLATFSGIFTDIKETLSTIGSNLVDFVLDALEGETVTFEDFVKIFDLSTIDTEPIKKVALAMRDTLVEEIDRIKINIGDYIFSDQEGSTRFGRIVNNIVEQVGKIRQSFENFKNSKLGESISNLAGQLGESWQEVSLAIAPLVLVYLPKLIPVVASALPQLGKLVSIVGKISIVFGVATTVIGNWEKIWPSIETTLAGIINTISGVVEAYTGFFKLFSGDESTRAEGFNQVMAGLSETFFGIEEAVIGAGTAIAQTLINALSDASEGIGSLLELIGAGKLAAPFFDLSHSLNVASSRLSLWQRQALEIFYGLRDQVSTIIDLIGGDVGKAFGAIRDTIVGVASEIWSGVKGWFYQLWVDLFGSSIVVDMVNDAKRYFTELKNNILAPISSLVTLVTGKFTMLRLTIVNKIGSLKSGISTAVLGVKDAILAPFNDALKIIEGLDISGSVSKLFASNPFEAIETPNVDALIAPITTAFESMSTTITGYLTSIKNGAIGLFDGIDLKGAATKLALSAAVPIANLATQAISDVNIIKSAISAMFDGIDVVSAITEIKNNILLKIGELKLSLGISLFELVEGFKSQFTGLKEPVLAAITNVKNVVISTVGDLVNSSIGKVTGFANDFIDKIFSIPARIKERISEFTDVGSLIKNAFGFGGEDIANDVASEFEGAEGKTVAPVESTTDKIKNAWSDAYNFVVGNSVVPDMVTGIAEQFNIMSTSTIPQTTIVTNTVALLFETMALRIKTAISTMAFTLTTAIRNFSLNATVDVQAMSDNMSQISTSLSQRLTNLVVGFRALWRISFTQMGNTLRQFGDIGRQVLTTLDNLVRKLTASIKKLRDEISKTKDTLDKLKDVDLSDLVSSFKEMHDLVKKTRDRAKEFAKFMESARDAAKGIGDTLGGNVEPGGVPGAQHGAWDIARDGLVYLHRKELVMPPEIAENFRGLMVSLQRAGIGSEGFNIPMSPSSGQSAPIAATHVQTNYITATFPNVTSAQEAEGINEKLNNLISDSRRFVKVGSPS